MKPEKSENTKKSFKVILLGEAGVGKTSLLSQYSQGKFSSQTTTTVGVDRVPISVHVTKDENDSNDDEDDEAVQIQVLDTAGCYAFHSLIQSYARNIDAVVFVYDITEKESFACLPLWNDVINRTCEGKLPVKMLVGNKKDLDAEREVQMKNAKNYADFEGMFAVEVSVKEQSCQEVFNWLASQLQDSTRPRENHNKSNKPNHHSNNKSTKSNNNSNNRPSTEKSQTSPAIQQRSIAAIKENIRKKFTSLFSVNKKKHEKMKVESPGVEAGHDSKSRITSPNPHPYVLNDYVASLINY